MRRDCERKKKHKKKKPVREHQITTQRIKITNQRTNLTNVVNENFNTDRIRSVEKTENLKT